MKSKTIKIIAIIALCLCSLSAVFIPSVHAGKTNSSNITSICDDDNIPAEVRAASGCDDNTKDELAETVTGILNAIIAVSGLISVIFIIVGGINYMTSVGDPGKIKKAKDTILYACIGLIICVLSFAIVNFVIKDILQSNSSNSNNNTNSSKDVNNSSGKNSKKENSFLPRQTHIVHPLDYKTYNITQGAQHA